MNGEFMSNPINKKTHDQFVAEVPKSLKITIVGKYINTDSKIEYSCKHGTQSARPWQILKLKHCCRKGYYESGKMWSSVIVPRSERLEWYKEQRPNLIFDYVKIVDDKRNMFDNIKCSLHPNVSFRGTSTKQHCTPCPECRRERHQEQFKLTQLAAWQNTKLGTYVSKQETKWLDSLGVKDRQVWLEDVKYKVDGFDPSTNTVYLYHGRFWHGCPNTFDPEMPHPIVKLPMKDLYEKTIMYENKIKNAGYNLIVKWGT